MTVKAVAVTSGAIFPDSGGTTFTLRVQVAGLESGNTQNFDQDISGLSPTITALTLEAAIRDAVKTKLVTDYGYTFGLLDTVRLIGALL